MNDETRLRSEARMLRRDEIDALLAFPMLARLATARDNKPHVVPVWFDWDGESLWIANDKSHRKIAELRVNPHVAVSIDQTCGGLRFWAVLMEGQAELIEEPEDFVREVTERIYVKYMGKGAMGLPTLQRMLPEGELILVKFTPTKIITWNDADTGIGPIG